MVDNIGGGSLKKITQDAAQRLVDLYVLESFDHIAHPRIPLLRPELETQVRFAQAQPPAAVRVLARTTQELNQERGECFDSALESCSRK